MSNAFADKVVAITGAGKGLGRAYAHHFAALGAKVVVNNRRHEGEDRSSADCVVEEIERAGGQAVAEGSAVEDPASGERLLKCALERFGRLDCLVANAGVIENRSFRKQSLRQFREVIDINLMGTVNAVHPVFRHLSENGGGSIVVSTSSAGLFGEFGLPAYSTAKAGLIGFMLSLNLEGARKQVRVSAIAPYAATQMTSAHLADDVSSRLDAAAVAPAVAWLAGRASGGEILLAGGGRIAMARMFTTYSAPIADFDDYSTAGLATAPFELRFASAVEHFGQFVAGTDDAGDGREGSLS